MADELLDVRVVVVVCRADSVAALPEGVDDAEPPPVPVAAEGEVGVLGIWAGVGEGAGAAPTTGCAPGPLAAVWPGATATEAGEVEPPVAVVVNAGPEKAP